MQNEDNDWIRYQECFAQHYDTLNYASPLQGWAMRASHRMLEKPYRADAYFERVLEIGAGTGEHLTFVQHRFDEYTLNDRDAAALDIALNKMNQPTPGRFVCEVQTGTALQHPDHSFDRLVAIHVLEHINEPHQALREWRRVLKPGGVISVLIPTDPGMAWRLGRMLGPRRQAQRLGINYDYVMAREHVNACTNLIALLNYYFPHSQHAWWPCAIASVDLNLFFAFHATIEKTTAAC